jgi:transcription elongation factor Elf1
VKVKCVLWVGICPKCGVKNILEVREGKVTCSVCDPPYTFKVEQAEGHVYEAVGYWRGYCPKCGAYIASNKLKFGEAFSIFCGECKSEIPLTEVKMTLEER